MKFTCKFICAKPYDFVDEKTGKRIIGCTVHCFDINSQNIIKARAVSQGVVDGKKFGDDIQVIAVPNGNFVRYEV